MNKKIKKISTQLKEKFKVEVTENDNIISFEKKDKIFEAVIINDEISILSNYNQKYLLGKLNFLDEFAITHNSIIYLENNGIHSINNGDSYYRSACSDELYFANANFNLQFRKQTNCMGTARYEYKVI